MSVTTPTQLVTHTRVLLLGSHAHITRQASACFFDMAQRTLFQFSRGSPLTTVSIIGSAGRRGDAKKMTRDVYWNMVDIAQRVISEDFKLDPGRVHLVSGGAAWAGSLGITKSYAPLN